MQDILLGKETHSMVVSSSKLLGKTFVTCNSSKFQGEEAYAWGIPRIYLYMKT